MSLFMETINVYGTEDTETIKSKVTNWIASQSRYIKGLFQNLCWESWVNNYNAYDEVYDHEDFADHELEDEDDYIATYDDDDDDYVSYDDVDSNDYDSAGDWDGDSYDGGEW